MAPEYELYSYFRSSCSARVRIAAHWKGLELKYKYVQLLKDEQKGNDYAGLNPNKTVPTLVVREDGKEALIRQSVAMLEYFEERHPETPRLLPPSSDPLGRAQVRDLVNIVACDTQPITNLKVLNKVKPLGMETNDWQQTFMGAGLEVYEAVVSKTAGKYSIGDEVTLADVVLSPAVDNCYRYGVDMTKFPIVEKIYRELMKLDAFKKGSWKTQVDTPENLR